MISARPADDEQTNPVPSDTELLAAHVAGSPTAFGELVVRHQDRLWAVALRIVRNPDDAEDVLQEGLLKAFRRAESYRGQARVSTWMHRIVVNAALDSLRRAARVVPSQFEPVEPPDTHDHVADRDTALDVADALAMLPPEQRAAVVLVDVEGFSVDEAAMVLNCPTGTVKSRCFRARARLAGLLADYDGCANESSPTGNQTKPTRVQPSGPPTAKDPPDTAEAQT